MSSASVEKWTEQLMHTAQQLARVKANQLLREQRQKVRSKERARRLTARRRALIGEAAERAGLAEWTIPEILGVLLEAHERVGRSPTLRMAARKRGEQHLGVVAPPVDPLASPMHSEPQRNEPD